MGLWGQSHDLHLRNGWFWPCTTTFFSVDWLTIAKISFCWELNLQSLFPFFIGNFSWFALPKFSLLSIITVLGSFSVYLLPFYVYLFFFYPFLGDPICWNSFWKGELGDLADKVHEPDLIFCGILSAEIFFTDQFFPPFLSFLLEVPFLQIIDDSNMIKLWFILTGLNSLIGAPEVYLFWRLIPPD